MKSEPERDLLVPSLLKPDTISNTCRGGKNDQAELYDVSDDPVGGGSEVTGFDWVGFDDATQRWDI